tara:strand:+ start:692 stop:1138 length:447 start_codon:yes stop_codon:yes gene_type:complete
MPLLLDAKKKAEEAAKKKAEEADKKKAEEADKKKAEEADKKKAIDAAAAKEKWDEMMNMIQEWAQDKLPRDAEKVLENTYETAHVMERKSVSEWRREFRGIWEEKRFVWKKIHESANERRPNAWAWAPKRVSRDSHSQYVSAHWTGRW